MVRHFCYCSKESRQYAVTEITEYFRYCFVNKIKKVINKIDIVWMKLVRKRRKEKTTISQKKRKENKTKTKKTKHVLCYFGLVGLIILFYGISTLFGSFNAELNFCYFVLKTIKFVRRMKKQNKAKKQKQKIPPPLPQKKPPVRKYLVLEF